MARREQPKRQNFYPLSDMPFLGSLIDERVQDLEQLQRDLAQAQEKQCVFDDATANRLLSVHTESLELAGAFDKQLKRWSRLKDLMPAQCAEVRRLQQQMIRYREGCQHIIAVAAALKKSTIETILGMSDEEVGRAVLSGELAGARREERTMPFTAEQLQVASLIDAKVKELTRAGVEDEGTLFAEMADFLPGFKRLMDTATPAMMEELSHRFPGFFVYARVLESVAEGIRSGRIQVPR